MAEIEYIKDLYENEGLSLREIARRTKKDFRTVQKYAYQNNWNPPVEVKMEPETYPVLGEYIPLINEWLEQDEREPRKQRHTISRVHERLQKEHGYQGSYSSVKGSAQKEIDAKIFDIIKSLKSCHVFIIRKNSYLSAFMHSPVKKYVNRKWSEMKRHKESFLPLAHPPGHAQTDFGEFKYYDGLNTAHKGHELVVSFPNSNTGWTQVFPSENQECLLVGLKRIFYHIGGVPIRLRLDNMSTAVVEILEGAEREITDGFYRFMLHHRFKADFCNPSKGNEKGSVENKSWLYAAQYACPRSCDYGFRCVQRGTPAPLRCRPQPRPLRSRRTDNRTLGSGKASFADVAGV